MTLDEFAAVAAGRIPTPKEFIGFVRGQGWEFKLSGETASITRVKAFDVPVAQATADMLKREPYRTNVLRELLTEPPRESPPTDRQTDTAFKVERMAGEVTAPAVERMPTPNPEACRECKATVYLPGPEIAAVCGRMGCPYFRLTR